jgi:tRNA-specific 2-thiouridylase
VTTAGGRHALLAERIPLHPGVVVDEDGGEVGRVDAIELVTVGQRRGLRGGGGQRRFALSVDPERRTVVVGPLERLLTDRVELRGLTWVGRPATGAVEVQCSAHGAAAAATVEGATVMFEQPHRRVAPGQSVVFYRGDEVLGGGIAA